MAEQSLKHKTISGILWQLVQKGSVQIVSFVVSVILARLIDPSAFGTVALTVIFTTISVALVDSGLGTSLVQKKVIDELDKSTVFYFGMLLAAVLYTVLFFCAPLIARMYETPELVAILRILGLNLFFAGLSNVQYSILMRSMDFKKYFYSSLISTVVSAIVGIYMAFKGFGVWAIVGQSISRTFVGLVTVLFLVHWIPQLRFSWERLKTLYSFGLNYMGASLIGTFFNELRGFLIGLRFQAADLAFYNRGNSIPGLVNDNINGTISAVLFPAMTKLQDDKSAVKNSMRRAIMSSVFILAPILLLLAATSERIILILYTSEWIEAVPYMQVVVFYYLFSIIGNANLQALNAIGRSDITFKLEFIKKPILLAILLYTSTISPIALSIGTAIYSVIGAAINAHPNKKLIGYGYREQIIDVLPPMLLALVAGGAAWLVGLLAWNHFLVLALQLLVGGGVYLLLAVVFRLESFDYTFKTIKGYIQSKV